MGALLIMSGGTWLTRPDVATYLSDAIHLGLETEPSFGFYRPFLEGAVLPNASLFALLVGLGELLSGVSLFFGLASRLGATVIAFQFLNYGLMGGPIGLLSHAIMIALVGITVVWKSGRLYGADRWLHARWPAVPIW